MIKPFYQIHLKILALIAAVCLWFVVITVENTVYKYPDQLEVEMLNMGSNITLESKLPNVDVYLRVDKEDLKKVTKNDLDIYVDFEDLEAGEYKLPVIASSQNALAQILKIEPSNVTVNMAPVIEKEVPIKTEVEGKPAQGYIVENTEPEAEKVIVSGAQSVIDQIEYIEAKVILDGTQTQDLKQSVQLAVPGSLGISPRLITYTPAEVLVDIIISSEIEEKELAVSPNFINENERASYENRINISPETVTVRGEKGILDKTQSIETNTIETSLLIRNKTLTVGLNVPTGIELLNPEQTVTVNIIERNISDGPTI